MSKCICLGALSSCKTWVYLSGLTKSHDSSQEVENRNILNQVGQNLGIHIVAVLSPYQSMEYDGKYNWPHNTEDKVLSTHTYVVNALNETKVDGYIGFSNGGFFLNRLVQVKELQAPVISVGAAGYIYGTAVQNELYLVNGREDIDHFELTKKFYETSKASNLTVNYYEHDEGHIIPKKLVEKLMLQLKNQVDIDIT